MESNIANCVLGELLLISNCQGIEEIFFHNASIFSSEPLQTHLRGKLPGPEHRRAAAEEVSCPPWQPDQSPLEPKQT